MKRFLLTGLSALTCLSCANLEAGSFQVLDANKAYSMSADGKTVLARKQDGKDYLLKLNGADNQLPDMGLPSSGASMSLALSGDGLVVGGLYASDGNLHDSHAFVWSASNGYELELDSALTTNRCTALSHDGSVAVGYTGAVTSGDHSAYKWTQAGGIKLLGDLSGGAEHSQALDVSGDGNTVVGLSYSADSYEAFSWTETTGMQKLGTIEEGLLSNRAMDVSYDGSVIVGYGVKGSAFGAFKWTESDGCVLLNNNGSAKANAVSDDGQIIAGMYAADTSSMTRATWWDDAGMHDVANTLENIGLSNEIAGWDLWEVKAVSDDGQVMMGVGEFNDDIQYWVAEIPEPGVGAVLLGVMGLLSLKRRIV